MSMSEAASLLTQEQWVARLYGWAVERWGQARADAIRREIELTAQALVQVAEFPLDMEHVPGFFGKGA
jgi:hypothetical protein